MKVLISYHVGIYEMCIGDGLRKYVIRLNRATSDILAPKIIRPLYGYSGSTFYLLVPYIRDLFLLPVQGAVG